ncbi:MAG: DNA cytosine methyltransferase [Pseudonocardiales bacterium]|nr:MAG: DNA cytosine methyltransferase [Pseudonocardiales bacterium]
MDGSPAIRKGAYGVKLVRGPFVRLAPHPDSVSEEVDFLAYAARLRTAGERLAADLFCGAGGLSLGLDAAGFRVVLAADHDAECVETHRHHSGGLTVDWDLGDPARVKQVARLIREAGIELLAGGPPCQPFSKAGRSKIKHRVRHGLRDPYDERRDLWRSFLEVIQLAMPPAVIMENVPDMALDREMFILRTMVHELEELGYAVEERVVETWRYGVPQFRQRLILVALRGGIRFDWPVETPEKVTVWNAIGDLPEVDGGWRPEDGAGGWSDYATPRTSFQRKMREGVDSADAEKVFDHITRPVREDDARAFEHMNANTRYSQLPDDMKRYRDDIFDDKYKRLDEDGLSRTITAHIAKDGYWYIHPRQNRTLTVREAARLQTFPDRFRFAGPPSAAFRQIGNAVPPILGEHLGGAVLRWLAEAEQVAPSTHVYAAALADWFSTLCRRAVPWLRATTRWQVISAEILLDRLAPQQLRHLWPLLERCASPAETIAASGEIREIARWIGREPRSERLLALAVTLAAEPTRLDEDEVVRELPGVSESISDLAVLVVPNGAEDDSEEPVLAGRGVLRVAARVTGEAVDRRNCLTDGRLAVARLIGYGSDARRAHLGLIELAASLCRPAEPVCIDCPLHAMCHESKAVDQRAMRLH